MEGTSEKSGTNYYNNVVQIDKYMVRLHKIKELNLLDVAKFLEIGQTKWHSIELKQPLFKNDKTNSATELQKTDFNIQTESKLYITKCVKCNGYHKFFFIQDVA